MRLRISAGLSMLCFAAVLCAEPAPTEPPKEDKPIDQFPGMLVYPKSRKIVMEGYTCVEGHEALEWGVVAKGGKEYESVVAVGVIPHDLQFALMALKYKEGGGVEMQGDPGKPRGDEALVQVEWEKDGETISKRLEELVWNDETGKVMRPTPFVYTGSQAVFDKKSGKFTYVADQEKIIFALYRDPTAMFNNPLETGTDDIFYVVNKKTIPPKGTKVKVIITPAPKKDAESKAENRIEDDNSKPDTKTPAAENTQGNVPEQTVEKREE